MTKLCYRGIRYELQSTSIDTLETSTSLNWRGLAYQRHCTLMPTEPSPRNLRYRGIQTHPKPSSKIPSRPLPAGVKPNFS